MTSADKQQIGPIEIEYSAGYWIARGPVPLVVALELYEHPIGRRDVRVCGYRSCPSPAPPLVKWYTTEGALVVPRSEEGELTMARRRFPKSLEWYGPIVFHDDPSAIGAVAFVDVYHIDSEAGLRLFVDTLHKHGIDRASRPIWWHRRTGGGNAAAE